MQIRWQDDAINDLIQIRRYISLDNPTAAKKVASRIRSAATELCNNPCISKPGRIPGTREKVLVDIPYIITYRVEEKILVILRVLHTSRKWPDPRV